MYDERSKFQITKMPRYKRKRFNPLPYIGAITVLLAFVMVIVAVISLRPWEALAARPTPVPTPLPSLASFPVAADSVAEVPTDEPTEVVASPQPGTSVIIYIVKPGDNFRKIAAKYHMSVADLLAANPHVKNPNNIFVGERLYIPVLLTTPTPSPTPQATSAGSGGATDTATPTPPPTD